MTKALEPLIIAAFGIVLGTLLVVLSTTVVEKHNAWPMIPLLLYFITPVPFFLCRTDQDWINYSSNYSLFQVLGSFLGGLCAVSGPSVTVALYHVGYIERPALILTLLSGVFFMISTRFALLSIGEDEEEDELANEDDDLFA